MTFDYFEDGISRYIWESRYRWAGKNGAGDQTLEDTWRRVANGLASVEDQDRALWADRFLAALKGFGFLPGGRILAGVGTQKQVTLLNCFVMGLIEDSMEGIFEALKEAALTMQRGGGVGCDFSTLRPRGETAERVGGVASGPISFMLVWDAMCATLLSSGKRRGAMMATLRCDHPDIREFIGAKRDPRLLRNFNLSVLVTDDFMRAVEADDEWQLVFPRRDRNASADEVLRQWPGYQAPVPCRIHARLSARELWRDIMRATYDYAEPGVLFIDRINRLNNLWYRETIVSTNPCGEVPLPPYGACDLGSVNLTQFVRNPFTEKARFDMDAFRTMTQLATRMLDNVISVSEYPLQSQAEQAKGTRRIGLGVTGFADMLILLGYRYGGDESIGFAKTMFSELCHTAYRTSVELAREKGEFQRLDRDQHCRGEFVRALPQDIRDGIREHGIRNSHLVAVAPTGTISLLANNVSSGLEPVFDFRFKRDVLDRGDKREYELIDYAYRVWLNKNGADAPLPPQFVEARSLDPEDHIRMQAAVQPFVDSAISKTVNIPSDYDFDAFKSLYDKAYELGLKGCTTFRPNPITGAVLSPLDETGQAPHCCSIQREAD